MPQLYNDGTLYNYNEFNRFPNLDGVEYKMVNELLHNPSQYAENIWKLIGYTTPDALVRDNLTLQQKATLICDENDTLETGKRVFITPYINDAWTDQSAHLHIYVDALHSPNYVLSNVHVCIETIVHAKVGTILSDVDEPHGNPNDSGADGIPIVLRKSRATCLLKNVIALFNGMSLDGVGQLQFNQSVDPYCVSTPFTWNSKAYFGHVTRMVIKMSGVSSTPEFGF